MTAHGGALTSQELEACRLVFDGASVREAAAKVNIAPTTLRRATAKPGWQLYLDELREAAKEGGIKAAVATLGKASSAAAAELVNLMRDEESAIRLRAAEAILSRTGIGEHLFQHGDEGDKIPADQLEEAILARADEIRKRRADA